MNFYLAAAALFLAVCTHTAAYLIGSESGASAERAAWVAREKVRADVVAKLEQEQTLKVSALRAEIETLRSGPPEQARLAEQARTEPRECKAMPENWRSQWNAN